MYAIRGIDRSAFVADLNTELVGVGDSLSADHYKLQYDPAFRA